MCWNKKLNNILDISDDRVAMHDWWMALAAACFGKIEFIKEPTILYRQHGNNVVGATKSKIKKIKTVLKQGYLKQGLVQIIGEIMFI